MRFNRPKKSLSLIFLFVAFLLWNNRVINAEVPADLKQQIDEKNKVLEEVNQKLLQAQKSLEETQTKSKTLQQEVKNVTNTINSLGLGIRSSEINIAKTTLEINGLQYDITGIEKQINLKKEAIAVLLRELQKKDNEAALETFLKNKSLAAALDEVNSIISINSGLSLEVSQLASLMTDLTEKLDNLSIKRKGLELENKNLNNRKIIVENQKSEKQILISQTKNQEKNYQQLVTKLEKEQDNISKEISDIEEKLRLSFDPNLLPTKRPGVFSWPVKMTNGGGNGYITQHFGEISYLYKGRPHNGLDIGGVGIGTPIFAAEDGVVKTVDNNDRNAWQKYQYGKYVLIEHSNNLSTLYAHLSIYVVQKNDIIKRGDLIGYSGKTGYVTGPHLHFGVYWTPSIILKTILPAAGLVPVGVVINPEDYL